MFILTRVLFVPIAPADHVWPWVKFEPTHLLIRATWPVSAANLAIDRLVRCGVLRRAELRQSPAHQSGNPTPDASALDRYFSKWQGGLLLLV